MNLFVHKRSFKKYVFANSIYSCKKSESVGGELGVSSFTALRCGLPRDTSVFCRPGIAFTQCSLVKWFRHMKFQCINFFNSPSLSAPIYSFEDQLRCLGHWFVEFSSFANTWLSHLRRTCWFLKIPPQKEVNGWLSQRYLRTNLHTRPFIWHLWLLERNPDNTV